MEIISLEKDLKLVDKSISPTACIENAIAYRRQKWIFKLWDLNWSIVKKIIQFVCPHKAAVCHVRWRDYVCSFRWRKKNAINCCSRWPENWVKDPNAQLTKEKKKTTSFIPTPIKLYAFYHRVVSMPFRPVFRHIFFRLHLIRNVCGRAFVDRF